MEPFVTAFGLPGAVILFLVGLLGWIVRKIVKGELVPARYLDQERERSRNFEAANVKLTDLLREVLTDKDLGLHILSSLRAQSQAREGDDQ